ncbi:hypothetical protein [Nocardioides nematodiphilus]|uniref:hypothetical protein n=1 Tax=Nocardioides nematodiphilus TaxID=2849669 RepID=UPI001CD9B762|nr:hypothetical protein [Nocardioides nematodiphilus]MCA1981885.1 hypothetical protein [Nocardioides nematodiphilus]
MQDLVVSLGLILFLLGLLTGLAVPAFKNPRMGIASHLEGVTNGPATVALLAYGAYANWLATQLGALWGAGRRFAPGATGSHQATRAKELAVDALLVTLAPAMIAGTVLLLVGVLR